MTNLAFGAAILGPFTLFVLGFLETRPTMSRVQRRWLWVVQLTVGIFAGAVVTVAVIRGADPVAMLVFVAGALLVTTAGLPRRRRDVKP